MTAPQRRHAGASAVKALFAVGALALWGGGAQAAEVQSDAIFTPMLVNLADEGHMQAEAEEAARLVAAQAATEQARRHAAGVGHEFHKGSEEKAEEAAGEGEHEAESAAEELGEEKEETHFTPQDIQVACMLLGSVAFVMSLFYLVNYPDDDIRRYSWHIISTTISIFTAVLLFSGINQILDMALEGLAPWILCIAHYMHCLVYLIAMQITIATISGAMFEYERVDLEEEHWVVNDANRANNGERVDESKVRTKHGKSSVMIDEENMEIPVQKRKDEKEKRKRRMKCWALLLAHMGGFAAINAGGSMQHLEIFRTSPMMTFIPVLITTVIILIVFHFSKMFRDSHQAEALRAGRAGVRAKMCSEEVEEAENDVLSLSISFLTCQSIRFFMSGVLPNVEGEEHPEFLHSRTTVFGMYGLGAGFAAMACVFVFIVSRYFGMENEEGQTSTLSRIMNNILQSSAMCFAWSLLFGTRWVHCWLKESIPIFNVETMMGRVVLALELSGFSCACVFGLDALDDATREGGGGRAANVEESKTLARALQTIINALSILVGFSWEHCFEGGVTAVASQLPHPETVKLALGVTVVLVIVPNWRRHILTKAIMLEQLKEEREKAKNKLTGRYEYLSATSANLEASSRTYSKKSNDAYRRDDSRRDDSRDNYQRDTVQRDAWGDPIVESRSGRGDGSRRDDSRQGANLRDDYRRDDRTDDFATAPDSHYSTALEMRGGGGRY